MKTCQQCGRRRPLKKLDVSSAQHYIKIILCKDEVSCILAESDVRVKVILEILQKDIVFIDDMLPRMSPEMHRALHLLLSYKTKPKIRSPMSDAFKESAGRLGIPITEFTSSEVNMEDFTGYLVTKDDDNSNS